MANPQQPEVRRSERNPALSPDAMRAKLEARRNDESVDLDGAVDSSVPNTAPTDDQAKHDQDKPDLDEFAEAFGTHRDES